MRTRLLFLLAVCASLAASALLVDGKAIPLALAQSQNSVQLVQNAGFEVGYWDGWQSYGAPALDANIRHSGSLSARMGDANNANDQVFQTVNIPANALQVSLEFWYRLSTAETNPQADYFCAAIWDTSGSPVYVQRCADFAQVGPRDWTYYTNNLTDQELNTVKGKSVEFGFYVFSNASSPSQAWVDDVALRVETTPPPQTYRVYLPLVQRPAPLSPPVINSFVATPPTVAPGGSSTLAWNVTGATSLSISPGIGMVTGSSKVVNPAATTEYVLTASNAAGSATARVTVNVTTGGGSSAGTTLLPFSYDAVSPTRDTNVAVDAQGGVHVAYIVHATTLSVPRPVLYAYCAANCASPQNWRRVALGNVVQYVNLALDPNTGRPRLLIVQTPVSLEQVEYVYGVCDARDCLNSANWTLTTVGTTGFSSQFFTTNHFFALDAQGRPRFVYLSDAAFNPDHHGAFYRYCDSQCTQPGNWSESRLAPNDSDYWHNPSLALTSQGEARLVFHYSRVINYTVYKGVVYVECDTRCINGSLLTLWDNYADSAAYALKVDSQNRPRLALYTGNVQGGFLTPAKLYYFWCDSGCGANSSNWHFVDMGLPPTNGYNVDLALDAQNRPRVAYNILDIQLGYLLGYAWCNTNCESPTPTWQSRSFNLAEGLAAAWHVDEAHLPCTQSTWVAGDQPSLALDGAGNPRIAFDVEHGQYGTIVGRPGQVCWAEATFRLNGITLFSQP